VLETLLGDLRFAGRMLRKSPVFTVVAIIVISLGSGAVTTIFSAMNAVVLRPLPGTSGGNRLVLFERRTPDFAEGVSGSYGYYRHVRDATRTLSGVAAWSKVSLSISTGGEGAAVYGNIVSGNYFSVLAVPPTINRFFAPDEDRIPLAKPVVVVSHSFWESHLGADSTVIGRSVSVNGHPFTLIGVAPAGFRGVFTPLKTEAWVPLMMQAQLRPGRDLTDAPWLWMFGRLERGATREAARRELAALTATWVDNTSEPAGYRKYASIRITDLTGLPDDARNAFLGFTALLLGAAGLVLLIASVNVASMLSARAVARRREMALRTARFYQHESCGKCTPCREGTNWTVKMLERVVRGEATPMDLDIVSSVQENIIGHCLCVLGDSMAMPVGAMVAKFRDEFEAAIEAARQPGPGEFDHSDVDRPLTTGAIGV